MCVREVCQALINEYKDECIQCPTTTAEWWGVSEAFGRRWNVPHACAAFDVLAFLCGWVEGLRDLDEALQEDGLFAREVRLVPQCCVLK